MSSNNNPQATTPQPPARTPAQSATAASASATLVTIEGQQFELSNLNEEEGARLYAALPPEYQHIANQYAVIAKSFDRIAEVQLPSGISLANGFENLKQAYLRGGGALPADAEPYLRQMDQQLQNMPGYAEAMSTIRTARSTGDVVAAAVSGAAAVIAMPARALNFFNTVWTEIDGAVTRDVSDAQALAFGSAYAAALYKQGADRQNMSTTQLIFSNPAASLSAGIAGLPVVGPYIATFFRWAYSNISSAFSANSTPALTWDQAYAEVTQELEANPNFRDRVNAQARAGDMAAAGRTMTAAQNVAGIATAPIVDAVTNDRTIINSDGQLAQVTTENGLPTVETDTTLNNGQPQGRGDRILDAAINIGGEPARNIANGTYSGEQVLGAAAGGGAVLYGANRITPGGLGAIPGHALNAARGAAGMVSNTARGAAAGYLQGTADTFSAMDERNIRTNSFAQHHNQTNGLDRLRNTATRAQAHLDDVSARQSGNRVGNWNNNRLVTKAQTALDTANDAVKAAEAAIGSSTLGTSRLAHDALRASTVAENVMGAANATRLGTFARGAGRLAGRAAPILTPVFAGVDVYNGIQASRAGDNRAATQSFASAGTVAAGAAVGAGIGVWFFGVGAIPGAAIGAGVAGAADTIGSFFGYGSKDIAGRTYDANVRPIQSAAPTGAARAQTINQAYAQAVRDFDANGSGSLSNQEIEAALVSFGYTHKNQIDTNHDGVYSKAEFLTATGYLTPPTAQVAAVGNAQSIENLQLTQEELNAIMRSRMAVNRTPTGGSLPASGGGQRPSAVRLSV